MLDLWYYYQRGKRNLGFAARETARNAETPPPSPSPSPSFSVVVYSTSERHYTKIICVSFFNFELCIVEPTRTNNKQHAHTYPSQPFSPVTIYIPSFNYAIIGRRIAMMGDYFFVVPFSNFLEGHTALSLLCG